MVSKLESHFVCAFIIEISIICISDSVCVCCEEIVKVA